MITQVNKIHLQRLALTKYPDKYLMSIKICRICRPNLKQFISALCNDQHYTIINK